MAAAGSARACGEGGGCGARKCRNARLNGNTFKVLALVFSKANGPPIGRPVRFCDDSATDRRGYCVFVASHFTFATTESGLAASTETTVPAHLLPESRPTT